MIFVMPKSGQVYEPAALKPLSLILKDGIDEAQKKVFNAEDGDMDDKLNQAETVQFLKNLIGAEAPAEFDDLFY